ncbi:MAG: asparagine synthase-related protein, partial [Pseudomonadota bacterium]
MLLALGGHGFSAEQADGMLGPRDFAQRHVHARGACAFGLRETDLFLSSDALSIAGQARIYNKADLVATLGLPAREDKAATPALLLASWQRWGPSMAEHLFGDFAFVIVDHAAGRIYAARDPSGSFPMWYALAQSCLLVSSTPAKILQTDRFDARPNEDAVARYLFYGRLAPPETLTLGMYRLPPGACMVMAKDAPEAEPRVSQWWRAEEIAVDHAMSAHDAAEGLCERLTRAVSDRLPDAGKIGVHVSGGLDSTFVALSAADALRKTGRCAPAGYGWQVNPTNARSQELSPEHARVLTAARLGGIDLEFVPISAQDALASLLRSPFDEPLTGLDHEEPVMAAAQRAGVCVMLSGWGGDEGATFNGRGLLPYLLGTGQWAQLVKLADLSKGSRALIFQKAASALLRQGAARAGVSRRRRRASPAPKLAALYADLARRCPAPGEIEPEFFDPKQTQRWLLSNGHIAERVEGWAVAGARYGIEYRYPMLDRRVMEFALSIPRPLFRSLEWNRL